MLVAALVFGAPSAFAQTPDDGGSELDDAGVTDAGPGDAGSDAGTDAGVFEVPDGSVGEGGADRDNEEGEDSTGRVPTVCMDTRDCAAGFQCESRRCRYVGIRDAEGGFGCLGMATGWMPMSALVLLFIRKRPAPPVR